MWVVCTGVRRGRGYRGRRRGAERVRRAGGCQFQLGDRRVLSLDVARRDVRRAREGRVVRQRGCGGPLAEVPRVMEYFWRVDVGGFLELVILD